MKGILIVGVSLLTINFSTESVAQSCTTYDDEIFFDVEGEATITLVVTKVMSRTWCKNG